MRDRTVARAQSRTAITIFELDTVGWDKEYHLHAFLRHAAITLLHLGGFGLLIMGVLDSSFLIMPLGNDLLVVALTARRHILLPYYAGMATAGSVIGCLIMDVIARRGGEQGLERTIGPKRLEYVTAKVKKSVGWALAVASLMPPPFPFTPFVAAAAALQYPRKKLLTVIAVARFARFSIDGALAVVFGTRILRWAQSPTFIYVVVALVVISIAASAISIVSWIRRSRKISGDVQHGSRRDTPQPEADPAR